MRCDPIYVDLVAGRDKSRSPFRQKGPTFTIICSGMMPEPTKGLAGLIGGWKLDLHGD